MGTLSTAWKRRRPVGREEPRREALTRTASVDPLTRLPNRDAFAGLLGALLTGARARQMPVWIIIVDLDNFNLVNDNFGHATGDGLLQEICTRLRAATDGGATLVHGGGDAFMLIVPDSVQNHADRLLAALLDQVREPVTLNGHSLMVTCSVGISIFPEHGNEPQILLQRADIAMHSAKTKGRNQACFYNPSMATRIAERVEMERELRSALRREQLSLHYQPKFDLTSGALAGMEALLRWTHPTLGKVDPDRFITIAEETGLIVEIGRWVLRTACRQTRQWHEQGLSGLRLAVNLSTRQLSDPGLQDDVVVCLRESGLDSAQLELEVTESRMMECFDDAAAALLRLKQLGLSLALDDFGIGYSSLSLLNHLPFDTVKIDRSFISGIASNRHSAAIVKSIIELGHGLDFRIVAEGVETAAQMRSLVDYHCDEVQGHLFSAPLPAPEFHAFALGWNVSEQRRQGAART
jgi:diguanylate cyclase (GGDEF)-like protein